MRKNLSTSSRPKGFTIIELLVVIAIVGLIASLALVALDAARRKGRDSKRAGDVKQMQTALELYYNSKNTYPDSGGVDVNLGVDKTCLGNNGLDTGCSSPIYIGLIPKDPYSPTQDYVYASRTVDGEYCLSECPSYTITFTLEGSVDQLLAGEHIATPDGIK